MRTWHFLAIAGLIGVASLALAPFEQIVDVPMAVPVLRMLVLVQPAILTLAAVAIGTALARKTGLGAPLIEAWREGGAPGAVLRRQLRAASAVGIPTAVLLLAYALTVEPQIVAQIPSGSAGARMASFGLPLATKLLYGGITEEILSRWGLVSLFAWMLRRANGRPAALAPSAFWAAIAAAALLFALGHLPLLFAMVARPPAWMIAAIILGNFLPGIAFGWLFWRRGSKPQCWRTRSPISFRRWRYRSLPADRSARTQHTRHSTSRATSG